MRSFIHAVSLFLLLVLGLTLRSSANGPKLLNARLEGSTPNVTIRGVGGGGAPWVVQEGKATVDQNGRIRVRVHGLLIAEGSLASGDHVPANLVGTVGGATVVHAALTCAGPGGGVPFTFTPTDFVELDAQGNFVIDQQVPVPTPCDRPILLIRVGDRTMRGVFIAATDPFVSRGRNEDEGEH